MTNVKVATFCSFLKDFKQFFIPQAQMRDCKNIKGLMAATNIRCDPEEWQLFTAPSMHSLKAVLLHKGNKLFSVPVACAVHKKETYENRKEILSCVNYKTFE
jgi:hypothetical protein